MPQEGNSGGTADVVFALSREAWGVFVLERGRKMFENTTKYSREAVYAFTDVYMKTVRRVYYRAYLAVLLIAGGICILNGLFLLSMWRRLDFGSMVLMWVILVVGSCGVFKGLFLRRFIARKTRKNMVQGNGVCRYVFGEDSFEAARPGVTSTYRYDRISKAYEAPGYFVLFMDKLHGGIIDMGGFTQGTADEFRAFLAEKLGKPVEYVSLK